MVFIVRYIKFLEFYKTSDIYSTGMNLMLALFIKIGPSVYAVQENVGYRNELAYLYYGQIPTVVSNEIF